MIMMYYVYIIWNHLELSSSKPRLFVYIQIGDSKANIGIPISWNVTLLNKFEKRTTKNMFWTLLNYHQLSQLVTVHSLLNNARVDHSQVTFKFPTLLGTWSFTCHVLAVPFLTKAISLGFDPGQKGPATNPWGIGVLNSRGTHWGLIRCGFVMSGYSFILT